MPLSDAARIRAQRPRLLALAQALAPLRSCVGFMNSGAHPDDETSAMLAALGARGFDLSYACSTRGEGGQNDIGTETGADLGALRTAEMQAAAAALDMRLYWLGTSADDPISDFGFSKSGVETLGKWGRDRTLARFVHILRLARPDILCPTFLDVPGQHGHHRAMTEAAHLVMDLAADPAFPGCDLPVWQVRRLFLPAWSGAGQAYDDDLPPPAATHLVTGWTDPLTGFTSDQIGQQSRVFHQTQGMGRWVPHGVPRDWPLHLADDRTGAPGATGDDIAAGLPLRLADLAAYDRALAAPLFQAQEAIDAALDGFRAADILPHLTLALAGVRAARAACPDAARPEVDHRLARKETQLARAIRIAAGVEAAGWLAEDVLRPGQTTTLHSEAHPGRAEVSTAWRLPPGWVREGDALRLPADAAPGDGYADSWAPDAPALPALEVTVAHGGETSTTLVAPLVPPVVLPAADATLTPASAVLNRRTDRRRIDVALSGLHPAGATPALDLPPGWRAAHEGAVLAVTAPRDVAPGLYHLPLTLDGAPAHSARLIAHPHIAPTARATPARLAVRVGDVALPPVRLGYIGGGNDRVDLSLEQLGFDLHRPDPQILSDADLDALDSLVIGIFALRFRPGLAALMPRLHGWVARGGTLVTLYHRPWDAWDPDTTPPRRLEIGQPSLRWRVTDETAQITPLAPRHPLLTTPNPIGADTWADWHKERGLYFARSWDAAYVPLLSMADPGETPLSGALLAADIGAGRHVHCALNLHHQMAQLTPGAFALMANLVARRA